jgi:hypothetical protein
MSCGRNPADAVLSAGASRLGTGVIAGSAHFILDETRIADETNLAVPPAKMGKLHGSTIGAIDSQKERKPAKVGGRRESPWSSMNVRISVLQTVRICVRDAELGLTWRGLRPQRKSFNGKPKATAFATGADAFGLPLNEMRAGRAHSDYLQCGAAETAEKRLLLRVLCASA